MTTSDLPPSTRVKVKLGYNAFKHLEMADAPPYLLGLEGEVQASRVGDKVEVMFVLTEIGHRDMFFLPISVLEKV